MRKGARREKRRETALTAPTMKQKKERYWMMGLEAMRVWTTSVTILDI